MSIFSCDFRNLLSSCVVSVQGTNFYDHVEASCEYVSMWQLARKEQAKLMDLWGGQDGGVDIDNANEQLEASEKVSPFKLDVVDEMK
jgi:hypothetical protein